MNLNEMAENSLAFGMVISILGYELGLFLKRKWKLAIFNPLLTAIVFVMVFLLIFQVDYDTYHSSAKYLSYLLTPATVCLAIPLYQQLQLLKQNGAAVIVGISSGVVASLITILLLSVLFKVGHETYVTLLPKSITTAIGIGVSEELGGNPSITVAAIIVTGVLGNMTAEFVCRWFRIRHPIARGVAIGTAAHAIGTSKAMELGEVEGAMSSLSIVIAGILTLMGANVFASVY